MYTCIIASEDVHSMGNTVHVCLHVCVLLFSCSGINTFGSIVLYYFAKSLIVFELEKLAQSWTETLQWPNHQLVLHNMHDMYILPYCICIA